VRFRPVNNADKTETWKTTQDVALYYGIPWVSDFCLAVEFRSHHYRARRALSLLEFDYQFWEIGKLRVIKFTLEHISQQRENPMISQLLIAIYTHCVS